MSQEDKDKILEEYNKKYNEFRTQLDVKLNQTGIDPAKVVYEVSIVPCGGDLVEEEQTEGEGGGS